MKNLLALVVICVVSIGCSSPPESESIIGQWTGTVTVNGDSLNSALTFQPKGRLTWVFGDYRAHATYQVEGQTDSVEGLFVRLTSAAVVLKEFHDFSGSFHLNANPPSG